LSFVKRSRIVSIRVTQEEYQTLDRISRRAGANSVSEFLRQLIMSSEPIASAARGATREVTEELDDLKREVDRLSQLVNQRAATASSQGVISDEFGLGDRHTATQTGD